MQGTTARHEGTASPRLFSRPTPSRKCVARGHTDSGNEGSTVSRCFSSDLVDLRQSKHPRSQTAERTPSCSRSPLVVSLMAMPLPRVLISDQRTRMAAPTTGCSGALRVGTGCSGPLLKEMVVSEETQRYFSPPLGCSRVTALGFSIVAFVVFDHDRQPAKRKPFTAKPRVHGE